jgi:hypothetical protein
MLDVTRYSEAHRGDWDAFVGRAKNGHFFFRRDYLAYHADRFADHSLLFFKESRLVALLPACLKDRVLSSHAGLTFGGIIADAAMTTPLMLEVFAALVRYLRDNGVARLVYKCVPHIYHLLPAEEDRYALFVHGARLCRRDVTSTVEPGAAPPMQDRRRRGIRKAQAAGVTVGPSDDFAAFWGLLEDNLLRAHGKNPVHTLAEILSLREKFPESIRLFAATRAGRMLGGTLVYENATVAHAQYIASSEEGRGVGALDALFGWLIGERYRDKRYFDFGISTERDGRALNVGLVEQKEGFGARAVVHDFYELSPDEGPGGRPCP